MLTFLKRLFGHKQETEIDTEQVIEESWQTDFHKAAKARFSEENGESYNIRLTPKGMSLSFTKKNVYAWTVDPFYRYKDFVLEGLIEFPSVPQSETAKDDNPNRAGTMAAGFLFRYLTESTFYSVLLSNRGMVRMDIVVNGTPIPVLGWTETRRTGNAADSNTGDDADSEPAPYQKDERISSVRIIARSTSFTIIVNDSWVAECSDDTIQAAGKIAFAGQNWGIRDTDSVLLNALALDSHPMEVETLYTRWNQYLVIPPESHIALARTWYAMGKYVPAILELKRAWKNREPGTEELLLSGQVYLAQRLLPEAETQVRMALERDQKYEAAAAELGGILYLQNRFVELEDLLKALPRKSIEESSFLSNLEGHLLHWKGDHLQAAEAYRKAARLAPDQGLFSFHEGNEWIAAGKKAEAVEAWLEAARVFLSANEYDDLGETVALLREAANDDPRVPGIAGKYYYGTGSYDEAFGFLETAVKAETADSAVWYLYGMILSEREKTNEAIAAFRKALMLAPDYGLYHFRLAETLFFAGENCDEELRIALETGDDNGWVFNLAALKALGENDIDSAEKYILKARKLIPDERPVLVNYGEIMRKKGKLDEVLPLLQGDDPESLRAGANLLVEDKRHEEAEEWYIKALKHSPFDAELLTDRAANCLELDLLNEADDLLGRAIDLQPSPRIYQLISYLAGRKGEFARAEVALQQGLTVFPKNADLLFELTSVYIATRKPKKAEEALKKLRELEDSARTLELANDITEMSTSKITCSACGRTWLVPKDMPPQGSLRLTAEPPDDLPAGTCPACQESYCIGCAKEMLGEDGRFRCKKCGQPLKLIDQGIIWLLNRWQAESSGTPND